MSGSIYVLAAIVRHATTSATVIVRHDGVRSVANATVRPAEIARPSFSYFVGAGGIPQRAVLR